MEIEERELLFTPEAPLQAWRLFRVRPCDEGFILSSPMYHDPEPPPWPQIRSKAVCSEDHPAPAPGCRCGIYAAVKGTLDSLPGYLLDTAHDPDPWAYAEVACTGRVFIDMRGVRAERAEVLRIAISTACRTAGRPLGERYGVPVGGLEDVPDWLKQNRRGQGPPPDGVNLDLDLDKLDLWLGPRTSSAAAWPGEKDRVMQRPGARVMRIVPAVFVRTTGGPAPRIFSVTRTFRLITRPRLMLLTPTWKKSPGLRAILVRSPSRVPYSSLAGGPTTAST